MGNIIHRRRNFSLRLQELCTVCCSWLSTCKTFVLYLPWFWFLFWTVIYVSCFFPTLVLEKITSFKNCAFRFSRANSITKITLVAQDHNHICSCKAVYLFSVFMYSQCHNVFDSNDFIELVVDCISQKTAVALEIIFSSIVLQTPSGAFHTYSYPRAFSCTTIQFVPCIVLPSGNGEITEGSARAAQLNAEIVEAGWWVWVALHISVLLESLKLSHIYFFPNAELKEAGTDNSLTSNPHELSIQTKRWAHFVQRPTYSESDG